MTEHPDWQYDIKISNDNTKGEPRITIHVRSDGDPIEAKKLAIKLFTEKMTEESFAS